MRTYDLSPLQRFTVGFDNMGRILDTLSRMDETAPAYPPYNIEKLSEDNYRIVMAVAGFAEDEIEITAKEDTLVVAGRKKEEEGNIEFLHRGIATRAFERRFDLAAHIHVVDADLQNGLLSIELKREVPEAMKPRKINIGSRHSTGPMLSEAPKAA